MSRGLRAEGNYRSCRKRVSQSTSDGVAREQLESSRGGNTEVNGDRRRWMDAGDSGLASQAEVGARSRACVREEETVDAERASDEASLQHTGKCAV
jgi:hypothetical protein